ncbi:MAG: LytTR family DNA-binding domain-containing protein [Bacteroidota bacterium]|jgi:two-component system LytT family response regulator
MAASPDFCIISKGKMDFIYQKKKIPITEIIMLEAEANYTSFHLISGEKIIISRTIKLFDELLKDHQFTRTHRSYLINDSHLKCYDEENECIMMSNNLQAMISRRKKRVLKYTADFRKILRR